MIVSTRPATADDLTTLTRLYRELEAEQVAIKPIWAIADGLPEPIDAAFAAILEDPDAVLFIGEIDGVPLGFVYGRVDPLLPQAGGERIGVVPLIFTEPEARGVGVGHEMIEAVLADFRGRGLRLFDARVSPGHRNAKNFFEAHGFAARLIVMHHDDARE